MEAASAVLESTGEPGAYADDTTTAMSEAGLQRILDRAGVETPPPVLHPLAYRDRRGSIHLPLDAAVAVARAFAAAEPQTVVRYVDDAEASMRTEGRSDPRPFTSGATAIPDKSLVSSGRRLIRPQGQCERSPRLTTHGTPARHNSVARPCDTST